MTNVADKSASSDSACTSLLRVNLKVCRTVFYQDIATKNSPRCPYCDSLLVQQYAPYYALIRLPGGAVGDTIMGADSGFFCPVCPSVVIDQVRLVEMVWHADPNLRESDHSVAVVGLIDLDARFGNGSWRSCEH